MNKVIRFTRLVIKEPRGIGHVALTVAITAALVALAIANKIISFTVLIVKEPRDAGRVAVILTALVITAVLMPNHVKVKK